MPRVVQTGAPANRTESDCSLGGPQKSVFAPQLPVQSDGGAASGRLRKSRCSVMCTCAAPPSMACFSISGVRTLAILPPGLFWLLTGLATTLWSGPHLGQGVQRSVASSRSTPCMQV